MHSLRPALVPWYLFAVLAALAGDFEVVAQSTTAVCKSGYGWASNSFGQSPCLMAAFLGAACSSNPSLYNVGPTEYNYRESLASATDCTCNSVAYSMFSACSLCQTQLSTFPTWPVWITNCTNSFVAQFPRPIPKGTAIPVWAFRDVTDTDDFSPILAQAIAVQNPSEITASGTLSPNSGPSNTSPNDPPTLPLFPSQTFSPVAESPTIVTTDPHSSENIHRPKKRVGAIVGGVIGGVAFLASVIGAAFLWVRRLGSSKRPTPASTTNLNASAQSHSDASPQPPSMHETGSLLPLSPASAVTPSTVPSDARLYDPNDPSTFPGQNTNETPRRPHGTYAGYPEV